jgi:hypothetical protein
VQKSNSGLGVVTVPVVSKFVCRVEGPESLQGPRDAETPNMPGKLPTTAMDKVKNQTHLLTPTEQEAESQQ